MKTETRFGERTSDTPGALRIVMFVANQFTHDARVTREARTLAEAGHAVTVIAVRADEVLPAREQRYGFTVERIAVTGRFYAKARRVAGDGGASASKGRQRSWRVYAVKAGRTMSALSFCKKAARRAAELRPDVYHCHDFDTLPAGRFARRIHKARIVYDSHELYGHLNVERPMRLRAPIIHAIERRLIRSATSVITVSDSFATHLAQDYGIARPSVVRNIPDTSLAPTHVAIPGPFAIEAPKLLYVGGVQRARGIEQTVRAVALLNDVHLIIMGPSFPADEARVRALVGDLGLIGRVHIVPPVPHEEVTTVSAHATLGVIPFQNTCLSHYLTIPNKIFECLHAGLPVVTSDFPELRKIVDEFDVGRVCDASDPASIAEAVRAVLDERDSFAEKARIAARTLTWAREASVLRDVYERLI